MFRSKKNANKKTQYTLNKFEKVNKYTNNNQEFKIINNMPENGIKKTALNIKNKKVGTYKILPNKNKTLYAMLDKQIGKYKLYKYHDSNPISSFIPIDDSMYDYSDSLLLQPSILDSQIPKESSRYELYVLKSETNN